MKEYQSIHFYFSGTVAHTSLTLKARCHKTREEMCFFHKHKDSITVIYPSDCGSTKHSCTQDWFATCWIWPFTRTATHSFVRCWKISKSPNQVRLNPWLTQREVIIPFSDYLRKDLALTSYLMDEWGCFSPCIWLARAVHEVLNYLPITAHFQETGRGQDCNQLQLDPNKHVLGYRDHYILNNGTHLILW